MRAVFKAVLDLKISEADERARFVSPNVRSLADAWLYRENGDVFPMAIYWNELVVGFLLLEIDKDEAEYFIWRIMIGQQYQGRGYGRKSCGSSDQKGSDGYHLQSYYRRLCGWK